MKELKFREFVNGKFHYWGFVEEGIFKGPVTPSLTRGNHSQFSGHKDKNSKEIYEGDIIKFFDKIVAIIVFESFGGWCFKWIDPTYINIRQYNPEPIFRNIPLFEVVGNIYENPELINP